MFCSKCGKEVNDEWKVCPHCGNVLKPDNTEIIQNSVPLQKPKKPIYKKWWFWIIVILVLIVGISIFGGDSEEETTKTEKKETQKEIDYSEMDFESLIGQSEKELKKSGLKKSDDYMDYGALDGDIDVNCTDGVVDVIMITGDSEKTPSFHGVRIGMNADEAYEKLQSAYSEDAGGDEDGRVFLNLSAKGMVNCKVTDGKVSTIMYTTMSDDDINSYKQEKEQKEAEKKAQEQAAAEAEQAAKEAQSNPADNFIGMSGVYICTDPSRDGMTGRITLGEPLNGAMSFSVDMLESSDFTYAGTAVILDEQTAQVQLDGMTITLTWANSENTYVTHEGELMNGPEISRNAGAMDVITIGNFTRASEFN